MTSQSRLLTAALIFVTTSLTFGLPVKAEETYNASCDQIGDGITLTSTGELVLENRLVKFKPTGTYNEYNNRGQRGICVMKQDPPGYKWIFCSKINGRLVTNPEFGERPKFINPTEAINSSVSSRQWVGACKVKL